MLSLNSWAMLFGTDVQTGCRSHIIAALPILMRHQKPLMLHAEVISDTRDFCGSTCDPRNHTTWEASRPPKFEIEAAEAIVQALRTIRDEMPELWANATRHSARPTLSSVPAGFKVHIAHLSSAAALQIYHNVRFTLRGPYAAAEDSPLHNSRRKWLLPCNHA